MPADVEGSQIWHRRHFFGQGETVAFFILRRNGQIVGLAGIERQQGGRDKVADGDDFCDGEWRGAQAQQITVHIRVRMAFPLYVESAIAGCHLDIGRPTVFPRRVVIDHDWLWRIDSYWRIALVVCL